MAGHRAGLWAGLHRTYLAVFTRYPFLVAVALITACGELAYAGINNVALPLLLKEEGHALGLHGARAAWVVLGPVASTFLLAETLLRIPFGRLSDRWGRVRMMTLGPAVGAVSMFLVTRLGDYRWLFPLRALDGMAAAALWPSTFALVGDRVDEGWQATAMSTLNTIYLAAVGVAPALVGLAVEATDSLRAPFLGGSVLLLTATLAAALWLRPVAGKAEVRSPQAGGEPRAPVSHGLWASLLAISFCQTFAVIMLAPFLALYASSELRVTAGGLGLILLAPAVTVGMLSMPLARLADRWGRIRAVNSALLTSAILMWLIPQTHRVDVLIVLASAFATAYALGTPAWLAILSEAAPPGARGVTFGSVGTAQGAGAFLGPLVASRLGLLSPHYPFYGSALALSLSALLALATLRRLPSGRKPAPPR